MASFYMLLKMHKCVVNLPGRPVISGYDSLTEPVSKCIDYYIKSFYLHFLLMFRTLLFCTTISTNWKI